ncbi:MAG TPA: UDP-N-acetylmuramoyl-L-alanyl-D-glutamate--2,6-diaminopimelate ligase [Jatrophihabitans sp.]|nr:UDP-N-acetylmuramoyl-L-alanyl-D-glutamate--2,6-diaminopimelate ligase [Jatrophihabitans sp.]
MAAEAGVSQPAGCELRPERTVPRSLAELASLAGGQLRSADPGSTVSGITSSSQSVRPGDLFAALPGRTGHGARFVADAARAGASAVLTDPAGSELLGTGLPVIEVAEPRAVLGPVAARIYGEPSRTVSVLGITGTSGKTTTSFLVRSGLQAAGIESGLVGTVGVFIGSEVVKTPFTTPEAPQLQALLAVLAERGIRTAVMEVSSHALRLGRVSGVSFAVGAFSNLSQDHLDFHTDMADYFQAKSLLFDGRSAREVVVIDDGWGPRLVRPGTVTVSAEGRPADWRAEQISTGPDGSTSFVVHGPGLRFRAGCRIPGRYNVANSLLAYAILAEAGVDVPTVAGALGRAQVPGRMERVDAGQPFLAVVDYSHKPAGVTGALRGLRPLTSGRLIIVLGCGGDRDRTKRPVMGQVAGSQADVLIVTDDNPRGEDPAAIRAEMLTGARQLPADQRAQILEVGDRRQAIEQAIALAESGDTVLIAGKGHETGQEIGGVMLPFDDVTVLRETLSAAGFTADAAGESAELAGRSAEPPGEPATDGNVIG